MSEDPPAIQPNLMPPAPVPESEVSAAQARLTHDAATPTGMYAAAAESDRFTYLQAAEDAIAALESQRQLSSGVLRQAGAWALRKVAPQSSRVGQWARAIPSRRHIRDHEANLDIVALRSVKAEKTSQNALERTRRQFASLDLDERLHLNRALDRREANQQRPAPERTEIAHHETIPPIFSQWKDLASQTTGRSISWSEWLTGKPDDPEDAQPIQAVTDEQLLNLTQWNLSEHQRLNENVETKELVRKYQERFGNDLHLAVGERRVSSLLSAGYDPDKVKVNIQDPLTIVGVGNAASANRKHTTLSFRSGQIQYDTFSHEMIHLLGVFESDEPHSGQSAARREFDQDRAERRNEAYTDMLMAEITGDKFDHDHGEGDGYHLWREVYEDEMKFCDMSVYDLSNLYAAKEKNKLGKLDEIALDSYGIKLFHVVDSIFDGAPEPGDNFQEGAERSAAAAHEFLKALRTIQAYDDELPRRRAIEHYKDHAEASVVAAALTRYEEQIVRGMPRGRYAALTGTL